MGFFVEALRHTRLREAITQRLAQWLPLAHRSDTAPLDAYQTQILVQELKRGVKGALKTEPKEYAETDVAFWKAILSYFANEVRAGKPIPKEIEKTLSHFVARIPRIGSLDTAWGTLQSVYEECLVCLKRR